jgi:hypothetical protein
MYAPSNAFVLRVLIRAIRRASAILKARMSPASMRAAGNQSQVKSIFYAWLIFAQLGDRGAV